ncbi:MAG: NAD(+) synthase [Clostridia bacterium]|nr:NAD(+) synthase [Clostridia bacterium]
MKYGFLKVCAATPEIKVADCEFNKDSILKCIKTARENGVKLAVFPRLCVTGATCGDLFLHNALLNSAKDVLLSVVRDTCNMDIVCVIGVPLLVNGSVYDCAAAFHKGKILAIIPNTCKFNEFYRFAAGEKAVKNIEFDGQTVPFGADVLVCDKSLCGFSMAVNVGKGGFVHEASGATVIAELMASKADIFEIGRGYDFAKTYSGSTHSAVICADSGCGESTTDFVLSGKNMIFEDGKLLAEGEKFKNDMVISEIDIEALLFRRRKSGFAENADYYTAEFEVDAEKTSLSRKFVKMPFVRNDAAYFEEAVSIQAQALKKRLEHTGAKNVVIGVSGGLDSTMALLVAVRAFDSLKLPRKNIIAITMPCFGTTKRTHDNAQITAKELGVSFREISIKDAVGQHFKDINQPKDKFDAAYENVQARERTQVLMDIANQIGGIVVGTGDMSELALGWATYNGDHMSMYGVNCGVPKTLMRFLVKYEAERIGNKTLEAALADILDTPVSPELLPPDKGEIAQKTEDKIGPYVLHDFFLYNMFYLGFSAEKTQYVAKYTFKDEFSEEEIDKWLKIFVTRFFSQQFKRNCSPDGPQVCGISLSPRGGFCMPSDVKGGLWLSEIEK